MFKHTSVLLTEAIDGLAIKSDGIYVDCTLGGGGHSRLILSRLTTGHLYCFDQDQAAIDGAILKLEEIGNNFTIIKSNFRYLKEELAKKGITKVDGVLFDLGVSSPQFDQSERGFSYKYDGRLDMRMNQEQELDAYQVVNKYSYEDLVRIFYKYGDEKFARQIARNIERSRKVKAIETTLDLVEIIKGSLPAAVKRKAGHPAKKAFQAIRIEVNDELNAFEEALKGSLDILKVKGRICVITFQSLEDKLCKHLFVEASQLKVDKHLPVIPEEIKPKFKLVNNKPVVADEIELKDNHRAHSAKLRIIERVKE